MRVRLIHRNNRKSSFSTIFCCQTVFVQKLKHKVKWVKWKGSRIIILTWNQAERKKVTLVFWYTRSFIHDTGHTQHITTFFLSLQLCVATDLLLGTLIQSLFHLHTLLYSSSHFPPCPHLFLHLSSKHGVSPVLLLWAPSAPRRQTDREAGFGGWGEGGADGGWRTGCEEQRS